MYELSVFVKSERIREDIKDILIDYATRCNVHAVYFQHPSYDDLQFYFDPQDAGIVPIRQSTDQQTES